MLVRVNIGLTVWGEDESMEVFEDATRKPPEERDGEGGGGKKEGLVDKVMNVLVEAVYRTGQPVTREQVHDLFGREVSRREWSKVDDRLKLMQFQYRVVIETGAQNKAFYVKQA